MWPEGQRLLNLASFVGIEQGTRIKTYRAIVLAPSATHAGARVGEVIMIATDGQQAITDSKSLRQAALMQKLPYYTTLSGMRAVAEAIAALQAGALEVRPLQDYF